MIIDLDDFITPHFKWREFLYCPKWEVCVFPTEYEHVKNITAICETLEVVRDILKSPLKINSGYRPNEYNILIGGSLNSYHTKGMAVDILPIKVSVHKAKIALNGFLEDLDCRMENNGRGGWIHLDHGKVGKSGRFFKP